LDEDIFNKIDFKVIDSFITNKQEENLHLDFKTVNSANLNRDDRKIFAKALSCFANSSGGLIIWGIVAKKDIEGRDVAQSKQPIKDLSKFIANLNRLTGELVDPIVEDVEHKKIEIMKEEGFVISKIPESLSGPHMAKVGEDRYYKRSGDSFYKMEHFDIEDMFGRRRKPKLELVHKITTEMTVGQNKVILNAIIGIRNIGRGLAKTPFLEIEIEHPYVVSKYRVDGNRNFGLPQLVQTFDSNVFRFGGSINHVIFPKTIQDVFVIPIEVNKENLSIHDINFRYKIGADDINVIEGTYSIANIEIFKFVQNINNP
jgi:hypothetical protein